MGAEILCKRGGVEGGGYLFRKMHWFLAPYSEPLIINPAPTDPVLRQLVVLQGPWSSSSGVLREDIGEELQDGRCFGLLSKQIWS